MKDSIKIVDLKRQYQKIEQDVNKRLQSVLAHGQYLMGPEVEQLEAKLADYVGVRHCISVASGTDALLIGLLALDIKPGDEVITPAFSFIAAAEMIALIGATPVLIDVDPTTYNLDPSSLETAISAKTKAIIPVSLYGQCPDLEQINNIASKYDIPVIEDGAQSLGATIKGRQSCSFTDIATTSFFPSKPLGAYGDGGACFTNDDELAKVMRQIRLHGQDGRYHHVRLGITGRLDTMQAAVLLSKLSIFEQELAQRRSIAQQYDQLLAGYVQTPKIEPDHQSSYAQYTIQVANRENIIQHLSQVGVPTGLHYPAPIHRQPAFTDIISSPGPLKTADKLAKMVLCLPLHPYMDQKEVEFVANEVIKAVTAL